MKSDVVALASLHVPVQARVTHVRPGPGHPLDEHPPLVAVEIPLDKIVVVHRHVPRQPAAELKGVVSPELGRARQGELVHVVVVGSMQLACCRVMFSAPDGRFSGDAEAWRCWADFICCSFTR